MSKIVEDYRDGQGDCFADNCEDCSTMSRSGYGKSGCYLHKLIKKVDVLNKQLEQADEIILDVHAQITTFSKYTASRVYEWKDIRGKEGSPDLQEFDDNGRDEE